MSMCEGNPLSKHLLGDAFALAAAAAQAPWLCGDMCMGLGQVYCSSWVVMQASPIYSWTQKDKMTLSDIKTCDSLPTLYGDTHWDRERGRIEALGDNGEHCIKLGVRREIHSLPLALHHEGPVRFGALLRASCGAPMTDAFMGS